MRVLVLGGTGKIGREVVREMTGAGHDVISPRRDELDLLDLVGPCDSPGLGVSGYLKRYVPKVVVNCAGMTGAEYCQENPSPAYVLNAALPAVLAAETRHIGALLVHLSSDMVYGLHAPIPVDEGAQLRPCGVYAATKAMGDEAVLALSDRHVVLRVSTIYDGSPTGPLSPVAQWDDGHGRTAQDPLLVMAQLCQPTPAWLVAAAVRRLADMRLDGDGVPDGVYNFACSPVRRTDLVREALRQTGRLAGTLGDVPHMSPTPLLAVPRAAATIMSCRRYQEVFGEGMMHWEHAFKLLVGRYQMAAPSP